jgi:hypothetical protein
VILLLLVVRLLDAIFHGQFVFLWILIEVVYHVMAFSIWFNGMWRELLGHGHRKSHLYEIIWALHTGGRGNPFTTYGDEKKLKKTAGATNRATPEGKIVYWHPRSRTYRTVRNNLYVQMFLAWIFGMIAYTADTMRALTVSAVLAIMAGCIYKYKKLQQKHEHDNPFRQADKKTREEVKQGMLNLSTEDTKVLPDGMKEVEDGKPKMTSEVPTSVLAGLLAREMGAAPEQVEQGLDQSPTAGSLRLPDTFSAVPRLREPVQEIIAAHTEGTVQFSWHTTSNPRTVTWVPIRTRLPSEVRFREWVRELEKLPIGKHGIGVDANSTMYVTSHNGDTPWHVRCMGSGTGKSTGFLVKAAQTLHQDPTCDVYGIDTKQVSFQALDGVPRFHLYSDPEQHMHKIWKVWYELEEIMRDRYAAVREKRAVPSDFSDIWIFVDEGNDLASMLKSYYINEIKERGDPASPPIWAGPISSLINLGRQVGIRGEFMFQNFTDKAMGGVSLRDAFPVVGMAGYTPNQWSRIIGTTPIPELKVGPGRIMMCKGPEQKWVQGFYDDEEWLRSYAEGAAA